jgi:hypothetical protein
MPFDQKCPDMDKIGQDGRNLTVTFELKLATSSQLAHLIVT